MTGILLNTYSIAAICREAGQCGVAVASAIPCVGSISAFAGPGAGAVATQSWCNPYLGIDALRELGLGRSASTVLETVVGRDGAPHGRQLGIVDMGGGAVAWTGRECTPWAGHRIGDGYAIQGNMLPGEHVLQAIETAFLAARGRDLSDCLVASLQAGETAGGESRGKQSASVVVFSVEDYPWLDVRVDDHPRPTEELRRIHDIAVLQLTPFIRDMPQRGRPLAEVSAATKELLAMSPPDRPGGGGGAA